MAWRSEVSPGSPWAELPVQTGLVPLGGPRGESASFLGRLPEAPAFLGSRPHIPPASYFCHHTLCTPACLLLRRTLGIALDPPRQPRITSHPNVRNLVTAAKSLLPHKMTHRLRALGRGSLGRPLFDQPHESSRRAELAVQPTGAGPVLKTQERAGRQGLLWEAGVH